MRPAAQINIIQGEFHASDDASVVISTVLGSCVAACLHDPGRGVGGMNHFLLPGSNDGRPRPEYGVHAMELLINELLRLGARRERLEGKLFGGARMVRGLSDIGALNAEFARNFLEREGITLLSSSLGGEHARRLRFWPQSGRAQQSALAVDSSRVFQAEITVKPPLRPDSQMDFF